MRYVISLTKRQSIYVEALYATQDNACDPIEGINRGAKNMSNGNATDANLMKLEPLILS